MLRFVARALVVVRLPRVLSWRRQRRLSLAKPLLQSSRKFGMDSDATMCKRYAISLFIGLLATLAVASCRPLLAAGTAQDSGFVSADRGDILR